MDGHILIMKALIDDGKQSYEETHKTLKVHESEFTKIKTLLSQMMVQIKNTSPDKVKLIKVVQLDCDDYVYYL